MRVLLTGFGGYLGPILVRRLHEAGHYVIGLDVGWYLSEYAELPDWPDKTDFGDIRDPDHWYYGVDVAVHMAGLSNDPLGALDPALTHAINVEGTLGLFHHIPGTRHIVISSAAVYGATKALATEETPVAPQTAYASGKAEVDAALPANAVSLRLGTVYGYSPGHRLDLVVNRMVSDAQTGVVMATGNAQRPLVHVEDVADAILFHITRNTSGVWNIVGENMRMQDLARVVAAKTGATAVFEPAGADARDYATSGAKLAALGWTAKRTVEDSILELSRRTYNLPPRNYERLSALQRLLKGGCLNSNLRPIRRAA